MKQRKTNSSGHPKEFQQVIREKSKNFVGREFVFTAITDFLHRYHRGYFTIVGAPGSGKSAILAKYMMENPQVVYYNAQIEGKNRAEEFLRNICIQLVETLDVKSLHPLPDNATEGSWFLSLMLQKMSDQLEPNQRLIIAIDALDTIDHYSQPLGSNLFYLPRYLPDRVYFLLTRRPFLREKSGLLIEAPSQTLDLGNYPEETREDVQTYIHQYLTSLPYEGKREQNSPGSPGKKSSEQEFIALLTDASENNFMYLSQIISVIAEGFYPEPFQIVEMLQTMSLNSSGLEAYYQSHWQKMKGQGLSRVGLAVLSVLVDTLQMSFSKVGEKGGGISAEAIAQLINEDEYEVEELLENWLEFLQHERIGEETLYSLYHSCFRRWLSQQLNAV